MADGGALVGVIMGSSSDARVMRGAAAVLDEYGIGHEDRIVSAHRTPALIGEYAAHAEESGIRVIIAGAGGAAHLPGMVASHTTLPVIGVPILVYSDRGGPGGAASAFGGLDSLLSMTEMPSGAPVAVVGVNRAANAGLYAARILAAERPELGRALRGRMDGRRDAVLKESEEMRRAGLARFGGG